MTAGKAIVFRLTFEKRNETVPNWEEDRQVEDGYESSSCVRRRVSQWSLVNDWSNTVEGSLHVASGGAWAVPETVKLDDKDENKQALSSLQRSRSLSFGGFLPAIVKIDG